MNLFNPGVESNFLLLIPFVIGIIGFLWVFRKNITSFQNRLTQKMKRTQEGTMEVPREWLKDKGVKKRVKPLKTKTGVMKVTFDKPGKIRIPGLRTGKRVLAVFLLVFNFFISQASLMSAPATQPMFLFFILNSFILLDYIWKTRKVKKVEKPT